MYLDIAIGIIFLVLILLGVKNGFFIEFLSIFGVAASFFISKKFTPTVVEKFASTQMNTQYEFIAYITVFIIGWMLMTLVVHFFKRMFENEKNPMIRLLGGLIGLGRGLLITGVLLLALNITGDYVEEVRNHLQESKSNGIFLSAVPAVSGFLPPIITEKLNKIKNQEIMNEQLSRLTY